MKAVGYFFVMVLLSAPFLAMAPASSAEPVARTILLSVDNVREAGGTIWVGVYTSQDDFLDREKARLVAAKVMASGQVEIELPDMLVGREYALGMFHDVNDNGEFDLNWIGLPAEPWAFSGQPKTRLRLPYFREVSFRVEENTLAKSVRLRQW